ncbi:MAG: response regulator [Candidatus Zixiibacteriota bacterium]
MLAVDKPQLALDALSKLMRQFVNKPEFQQLIHTMLFSLSGQLTVTSAFGVFKRPESSEARTVYLATGRYTTNKQLASLILTNDICEFFISNPQPAYLESIPFPDQCCSYGNILRECDVRLLSPLVYNDKLLGIIGLGPKVTGKPYGKGDLSLFETIISTVTPLVANSYQFWEVQKLGAWYFDILNNVKQGVLTFGDNFRLKKINSVAQDILTRHRPDLANPITLINGPLEEIFPQKSFPDWNSRFTKLITEHDSYFLPDIMAPAVDSTHFYDVYIKRITGDSDFQRDFIITLDDVTERKEAERALHLTQYSIDHSSDAALWINEQGFVMYVNETCCRLYQKSRDEILGSEVKVLSSEFDLEHWHKHWASIKAQGSIIDTTEVKLDCGRTIPVDIAATYINFDGEEYICILMRDITERRETEQKEKRLMERLEHQKSAVMTMATINTDTYDSFRSVAPLITELIQKATNVTNVNLWLFDESFTLLECIDDYISASGKHEQNRTIRKDDFQEYFSALNSERIIACTDVLEDPRTYKAGIELLIPRGISSLLDAAISVSGTVAGVICLEHEGIPRRWENDEIKFVGEIASQIAVILMDFKRRTAERHELEMKDKLERAERMEAIGVLAGGVAHDLNNMLGPLVGYPELLLRKMPEDSPYRRQIEKIGNSAQSAANIIQDLLTLARRGRYEMSPISLNDVINQFLDSAAFAKKCEDYPQVKVAYRLGNDLPLISGSIPHLSKVIMNLIVNAFDAMPEGGDLIISSYVKSDFQPSGFDQQLGRGDYAVVSVKDSGTGIAPDDIKRIFEPYYSKKKMGSSGSGLGLAVVYGIVNDHKGCHQIDSEVGKGTEFRLYFPITHDAVDETVEDNVLGGQGTILVVDDVEEQREIAKEILISLGYQVATASNGHEALTFLKSKGVDIVVLDMIMEQGFDGLDTYEEILRLHPGQKAIIISGYSATERVEKMQQLGAGQYVRKPFTVDGLGRAVKQELEALS